MIGRLQLVLDTNRPRCDRVIGLSSCDGLSGYVSAEYGERSRTMDDCCTKLQVSPLGLLFRQQSKVMGEETWIWDVLFDDQVAGSKLVPAGDWSKLPIARMEIVLLCCTTDQAELTV